MTQRPRIRVSARQLGDRHFLITLSPRAAVITQSLKRPGKNGRLARVKSVYFGFDSHGEAISFANSVRSRFPRSRMEVRQAKRLDCPFELKLIHDCGEQLIWDFLWNHRTVSQAIQQHTDFYLNRTTSRGEAIVNHALSFRDRSAAPLQGRSRPQMARCGDRMVSIE